MSGVLATPMLITMSMAPTNCSKVNCRRKTNWKKSLKSIRCSNHDHHVFEEYLVNHSSYNRPDRA